jgi:hypothetical protein
VGSLVGEDSHGSFLRRLTTKFSGGNQSWTPTKHTNSAAATTCYASLLTDMISTLRSQDAPKLLALIT